MSAAGLRTSLSAGASIPAMPIDAVTTIEGLGTPESLHPMQAAFVKHDGYQCGYCTPGQLCSAVGLMNEGQAKTLHDVR